MHNPYKDFQAWGSIGGKLGQRRLLQAKNRQRAKKPKKRGRPVGSTSSAVSVRNLKIKARFLQQGVTLEALGAEFGVTRERIRQILVKQGVGNEDGGLHKSVLGAKISKAAQKQKLRQERREAKCAFWMGCSTQTFLDLTGVYWQWKLMPKPARRFIEQKNFAFQRKIDWNLTFPEWWEIWRESGKYHLRGRGQGRYVMSRYGDTGAYEVGNVEILPSVENSSETKNKRGGLPMGVYRNGKKFAVSKMIAGIQYHVGTFASAEDAQKAYAAFDGKRNGK